MDVRRLQKTGGSSLVVTLPKKWVKEYKLLDKDVVKISTKAHVLVMQPILASQAILKSVINFKALSPRMLARELIAHYISGVDEIIITSDKFSPEERSKLRS